MLLRRHHEPMHHHQDFILAHRHYCDLTSLSAWPFNSFLALNPFQPAWIFVAAILHVCNSLRILNPFQLAWIFVADFSSIDVPEVLPFERPFFDLRLFLSCLRTRYPFHWAWILVAASSSDCDELGLLGCIALICIIGEYIPNKRLSTLQNFQAFFSQNSFTRNFFRLLLCFMHVYRTWLKPMNWLITECFFYFLPPIGTRAWKCMLLTRIINRKARRATTTDKPEQRWK